MKKFKKIISYYKPYKKEFITSLIFSVLTASIDTFIPFICRFITDRVIFFEVNEAIKTIYYLIILILFFIILRYFFCKYCYHKGHLYAAKIEVDIKNDIFRHLQTQDFAFFDNNKVGKLMTSITNDAFNISVVLKHTPEVLLDAIIKIIFIFLFLFFNHWKFALILFVMFVFVIIFMWYFLPKIQKLNADAREIFSDLASDLEENLSGIRTVQSFCNENIAINKFNQNNKKYLKTKNKMYLTESVFYSGILAFIYLWAPIITAIGSIFILKNSLNMSQVITFLIYVGILEGPLWGIVRLNDFLKDGLVGFDRIIKILETKPKIKNLENNKKLENLKNITGKIEFKNIFFGYNKEKIIFENLNLKINPGEYIALVGASGSGKTTICNLIPRFYDVLNGEILIDNKNIKNIEIKNLRQNIGFVRQDTFLFSGTIKENISFGKINSCEEEIIEAAKKAYAHDFIMNLPDKYETQIGNKGMTLSGGQRQRIAIAQVFLKNPKILIFDEATSSLDNESEKFIQKSMEKLSENRTMIVIAHRLSTIKNAKRILVLSNGRIAEEGTHKELLSKNGVYHEFYNFL